MRGAVLGRIVPQVPLMILIKSQDEIQSTFYIL